MVNVLRELNEEPWKPKIIITILKKFPRIIKDLHRMLTFLKYRKKLSRFMRVIGKACYYVRQLQIKFEKDYFHWVTYNALLGLKAIGYLKDKIIKRESGTSTRYFAHKTNRYYKRQINEIEKIIQEYSNDTITKSCGQRAEDLFCNGLALRGFMPKAKKVKSYRGIKWEKTGHDLDFLFEKDGVTYGCEIKNTLGYIRKELLVNYHQINLVALPASGFACPTSSVISIHQSYWWH